MNDQNDTKQPSFTIEKVDVAPRKLKATWTVESLDDLRWYMQIEGRIKGTEDIPPYDLRKNYDE